MFSFYHCQDAHACNFEQCWLLIHSNFCRTVICFFQLYLWLTTYLIHNPVWNTQNKYHQSLIKITHMQKNGTGSSASCITAFRQHWHNVLFQQDHWDCLILAWGRMYKNHYTKAPIQQTHVSDLSCDIFFGLLLIPPTKLCCFITS